MMSHTFINSGGHAGNPTFHLKETTCPGNILSQDIKGRFGPVCFSLILLEPQLALIYRDEAINLT